MITLDIRVDLEGNADSVLSVAVRSPYQDTIQARLGDLIEDNVVTFTGEFTSESNETFNASLKVQDPRMGIRDLDTLHEFASDSGLIHEKSYAMPANNMLIVWRSN